MLLLACRGLAEIAAALPDGAPVDLSAVWVLLVIGHYAEVTAPALYGRDINLYWDLRFMPDVAAMVVRVAPLWLMVVAVAAVALILALLYLALRWAFGRVGEALADARTRALAALGERSPCSRCSSGQHLMARFSTEVYEFEPTVTFPTPVLQTYARQARLVLAARAGREDASRQPGDGRRPGARPRAPTCSSSSSSRTARSPSTSRTSRRSSRRPRRSRPPRSATTHREVVSAFVESPTFGGSSWLAHISLMSGVEVRDPDTNAGLMAQQRDTLVTRVHAAGATARWR